jgi:hypothetical protein
VTLSSIVQILFLFGFCISLVASTHSSNDKILIFAFWRIFVLTFCMTWPHQAWTLLVPLKNYEPPGIASLANASWNSVDMAMFDSTKPMSLANCVGKPYFWYNLSNSCFVWPVWSQCDFTFNVRITYRLTDVTYDDRIHFSFSKLPPHMWTLNCWTETRNGNSVIFAVSVWRYGALSAPFISHHWMRYRKSKFLSNNSNISN